jgi:hypothetical protein
MDFQGHGKCNGLGAVPGIRHLLLPALYLGACAIVAAPPPERVIESVLPALVYNRSCTSTVALQNLADKPVALEVEAHQGSGALVPLSGQSGMLVHLAVGQQGIYKLQMEEETTTGWVKVRERISSLRVSTAVAVSGTTECRDGNELRVAGRAVAYPSRNPWFSGRIAEMRGEVILLVNTSEHVARAHACYSAGNLYSVPTPGQPGAELRLICSNTVDVQIPPFGSREFPVEREGNQHFSLRTEGESVVLQGLRALDAAVKVYTVDSTITFGEEIK